MARKFDCFATRTLFPRCMAWKAPLSLHLVHPGQIPCPSRCKHTACCLVFLLSRRWGGSRHRAQIRQPFVYIYIYIYTRLAIAGLIRLQPKESSRFDRSPHHFSLKRAGITYIHISKQKHQQKLKNKRTNPLILLSILFMVIVSNKALPFNCCFACILSHHSTFFLSIFFFLCLFQHVAGNHALGRYCVSPSLTLLLGRRKGLGFLRCHPPG